MQLSRSQLFIGVVLSFATLFSACGKTTQSQPQVEITKVVSGVEDSDEDIRSIEIDAFKYGYSLELIHVQPGETITIELTNSNGFHDFVIDELGVASKQINKGEKDTVTFTIPDDAAGKSYEYYCSVANHRDLGMVGKIVVEEKRLSS